MNTLNAIQVGAGGVLLCPRCKENYLHHCGVEIYERAQDDVFTLVTTVTDKVESSLMASKQARNPSSRRNGIAIRFWCERCEPDPEDEQPSLELTIAQDKGATILEWREFNAKDK